MNPREKTLALVVGVTAALFGAGLGLKVMLFKPINQLDKDNAALQEQLDKIKSERRAYFLAEDQVKGFALRCFDDQMDEASAKSGAALTRQIANSALQEADFSRLPVGPRKLHGAQEIGWSIQGDGRLENVINLLFLLQESPYLHRLDNLIVIPGESPGLVKVRLRYLTLVMDPAPLVDLAELPLTSSLNSPERRILDSIVSRDILRPYVKRPPETAAGPTASGQTSRASGLPPGPESLQVVSLSEWQGQPEVHVRDLAAQKTLRFKPGDHFADAVVVMVDYRTMPMPGNEALKSFSRVILRIGAEYWAIERGRTLADKYKLSPEQLPEILQSH